MRPPNAKFADRMAKRVMKKMGKNVDELSVFASFVRENNVDYLLGKIKILLDMNYTQSILEIMKENLFYIKTVNDDFMHKVRFASKTVGLTPERRLLFLEHRDTLFSFIGIMETFETKVQKFFEDPEVQAYYVSVLSQDDFFSFIGDVPDIEEWPEEDLIEMAKLVKAQMSVEELLAKGDSYLPPITPQLDPPVTDEEWERAWNEKI
jgi:hypothetical protein